MRKLFFLLLFVFSLTKVHSQEIYLQTGKNFTNYDYKSDNSSAPSLQAGSGNFYEIGYIMTLNNEKLKYAIGLGLNEYNAIGGSVVNSYSWNTQYLGIQNTFSVAFVKAKGFEGTAHAGLGMSTLIYGKQNLNGQYLDLASQKEFSGFWVAPRLGIQASYNIENDIFLSLGYGYAKSFNLTNSTTEKLSFNTNQIQFGLHFMFK
ncbi:outer membrane beta-barrel protein [Flavobacterium aciduliphilum]|uniref:Outer membrane protein with beta-barrel domain n=1 Tax=Flavobacterium aciduliphilum TaxID=1101402 RepID=A0A328YDJ8_9FLAO|nr:outer membrane beta-barrel protein [Flavobacterium aciduliphilum]RAR70182.1 outer membrane protein with beta-barrel domain [Flavobacterium aciduliphilum]